MMPDPGRAGHAPPPPSPVHHRRDDNGDGDGEIMTDEAMKQAFSAQLFAKLRKFELDEKKQDEPIKSIPSALGAYKRGLQMEHEVVRMRARERQERALKRRRIENHQQKQQQQNSLVVGNSVQQQHSNPMTNENRVKSR